MKHARSLACARLTGHGAGGQVVNRLTTAVDLRLSLCLRAVS